MNSESSEQITGAIDEESLPHAVTTILGRDNELRTLLDWLATPEVRLIVILGVGGVGKTSLALEAARQALHLFPHGARFVELGSLSRASMVAGTVLRSVVPRAGELDSAEEALIAALRSQNQLLVLDCFERLIDESALIARLLAGCPHLKILVTSRERLRLSGVRELRLAPLALPGEQGNTSPEEMLASPAVQLFIDRGQAVVPSLTVSPENAGVIAAICRRVDGLPLAIELAASRCAHVSPHLLLPMLAERLTLLVGGNLDAAPRHRTMRDSIAWSVELLSDEEQMVFRRIGILAGAFSLTAAAYVIGPSDPSGNARTLHMLSSLVDKSLLHRDDTLEDEPRFAMLDTIREYALEQLDQAGERRETSLSQAQYIRELAATLSTTPAGSRAESMAVLELETDIAGVRTALTSLREFGTDRDLLELLVSLGRYWRIASRQPEGAEWLSATLQRREEIALDGLSGLGFETVGLLYRDLGHYRQASTAFEHALRAYRAVEDMPGVTRALNSLGALAVDRRDREAGRLNNEAALSIQRANGDRWGIARSLHNLGWIAIEDDDLDRAQELFEQSADLWGQENDLDSKARALNSLGGLASMRAEFSVAVERYHEALELLRGIGARSLVAESLVDLAAAHLGLRQLSRAAENLSEALTIYSRIGSRFRFAEAVEVSAALALAVHRYTLADRWLGLAETLRRESDIAPAITWAQRLSVWQTEVQGTLASPSAKSESELTFEQFITQSLELCREFTEARNPAADDSRQPLSRREREVLQLVAAGMTDKQIADTLFISRRTASTHVAAILLKLDVPSRAAAAVLAIREGLV